MLFPRLNKILTRRSFRLPALLSLCLLFAAVIPLHLSERSQIPEITLYFPIKSAAAVQLHAKPLQKPKQKPAQVALIIDDMGLNQARLNEILQINQPLNLSFLPYGKNLDAQVARARQGGHEIMLHLPMEAQNQATNPGPNALYVDMTTQQIKQQIIDNLAKFDGFVGLNNHMGSKFTASGRHVDILMQTLQDYPIYFVDSLTSARSKAHDAALFYGIPALKRDIFIDHAYSKDAINQQLKNLTQIAKNQGFAIAIAHPKPLTIKYLKQWINHEKSEEIQLVKVSHLIDKHAPGRNLSINIAKK